MTSGSHLPMLLRTLERDGIARINAPFSRAIGYSVAQLVARPLLDWIHPDDRPALEQAIEERAQAAVGARHLAHDGSWVPMSWQIKAHVGDLVVLGVLGGEHPSTAEVATTATSDDVRDSLPRTLEAMALIVEARNPGMLCSILLVDDRGEHVTVGAGPSLPATYNQAVEGLRIGPMVGSCGTAAFWNTPVVVEDIDTDPLWRDLRGAALAAGVRACWSHPILGSNGRVLGAMALYDRRPSAPEAHQMHGLEIAAKMVGLAVERHRLEQRLRRTEKMEALGLLAGGIAHDFNNLLVTILGNTELVLGQVPSGDVADLLEDVRTAGRRAAEMCSKILAYAGHRKSSRELVACHATIREVGALLRLALSKKAALVFDLAPGECGVIGDAAQIQSVIMNLITNASEALEERAGTITVRTRVRFYDHEDLERRDADTAASLAPGDYVELTVADTGCGIDATHRTRVFDPFFSTKSNNRGLGLAAAQGIVRSHGGALTFRSQVGAGTTFTILLPQVPAPEPAKPGVIIPAKAPAGARVLVADDEPAVRNTLSRMLRVAGFEVLTAADGEQAVAMFAEHRASIDCVLLDYSMPKLNGIEALLKIRALDRSVPAVLISGLVEQGLLERYHDVGLDAVLHKPTPADLLIETIARALRRGASVERHESA